MAHALSWDVVRVRVVAFLRAVPRDSWLALLVLIIAIWLRLNALSVPVDNYDEGVYVASLQSLASGHTLYAQVYCAQPPLFLLLLLPWYHLWGMTLFAARFGIVLYSLLGLGAMWWLGRQLGGQRVALIALTLLAFDPLYLEQSRVVEAEVPALAFAILAVAMAASARHTPDLRRAALSGVAFGIGFMIKLFVLPAIIPIGVFLLAPWWGSFVRTQIREGLKFIRSQNKSLRAADVPKAGTSARRWPTRTQLVPLLQASWPTVAASGGAFVAVVLLAFLSQPDRAAEWAQVIGLHASAAGALAHQRSANVGIFLNIWWEVPLIAAGSVAGIVGWRQGQWEATVLAVWGAACVLVLAIQTPLFAHHMTLLPPAFIPGAALLGSYVVKLNGSNWRGITIPAHYVLALILLIAFGKSVGQEIAAQHNPPTALIQAANDLQQFTVAGDLVVTDDQIVAVLAGREVPAPLVDTSTVRITTGALTTQQVIASATNPRVTAILWYGGRFDHLAGLRTWVTSHFVAAVTYGDGRVLYVHAPMLPPPTG